MRREMLVRMEENSGWGEAGWGKAAERLRRVDAYASASTVMASPLPLLRQVRLNILTDRKFLILPTPQLQKGFGLLDPAKIPPPKRSFAVGNNPGNDFAGKIPYQGEPKVSIDLIVTDALAVGTNGTRLGDGRGFLDLQYAILEALGWLAPKVEVAAVVEEMQICEDLPMEEGDVRVHWIVTPSRVLPTSWKGLASSRIFWEKLTPRDIKRNDALFFLNRRLNSGAIA